MNCKFKINNKTENLFPGEEKNSNCHEQVSFDFYPENVKELKEVLDDNNVDKVLSEICGQFSSDISAFKERAKEKLTNPKHKIVSDFQMGNATIEPVSYKIHREISFQVRCDAYSLNFPQEIWEQNLCEEIIDCIKKYNATYKMVPPSFRDEETG